ncbi:MAG: hypothetical protein ACREMP_06880 [Candidatus Tyrphobacter sp.]
MKLLSLVLLAYAMCGAGALAQASLSPAELLAHGSAYDGHTVTVAGTVHRIVHRVSHRGNAYTTFDLCFDASCIRVFEFGNASIADGASTTVSGTFSVEKRVGSTVYRNELDVQSP